MRSQLIKMYIVLYINDVFFTTISFIGFATFQYLLMPVALIVGILIHTQITKLFLKRYNLKKKYPNKQYLSYKYVVIYAWILVAIIGLHIFFSLLESFGILSTIVFEAIMYSLSLSLFGGYPLVFGIYYLGMVISGSECSMYEYLPDNQLKD